MTNQSGRGDRWGHDYVSIQACMIWHVQHQIPRRLEQTKSDMTIAGPPEHGSGRVGGGDGGSRL